MEIEIKADGQVIVRVPEQCSRQVMEGFLLEKSKWIRERQEKIERSRSKIAEENSRLSPTDKEHLRQEARAYFEQSVKRYAGLMGVSYGRITIRQQKTRWGSCSRTGNLNFNCLLMLAPEFVREYVTVHELAHRKEMNHSARFYQEIAGIIPDYNRARKWLKEYGMELIQRGC